MKTKIKLKGHVSFDIVKDHKLQHSSIRVFFHILHLYIKNGEEYIYNSLYNDMLKDLKISNQTLSLALKQLKKCEYIIINEDKVREVIINGRGSFPRDGRKGSPPCDLRASFEPEKADAAEPRVKPTSREEDSE